MKRLIALGVKYPLVVNLITLFFVVAGGVSLAFMGREAFPNVSFDRVIVRTDYFGAPAEEIEKLVTIKIEDELKEVDGIDKILSVSAENVSLIVIEIDPDEADKQKVVNDIQRAVDRVRDLPEEIDDDPVVTEIESKNRPILNVSLSGEMDEWELRRYAKNLETRLLDIPDVAKVVRIGWHDQEIWVEVDPKRVKEDKLSLEDVVEALAAENINLPAGTLKTGGEGEYLVRTMGEFETVEEIKKVIIRANDVGNWVRVSDVATVHDAFEDDDRIEKTFGSKAITLTVVKKESGDIIDVVNQVKEVVERFREEVPESLRLSLFDDLSFYVRRRIRVLTNNGLIGMMLVLGTLFLFLAPTVAFWTAVGIPVALCVTFVVMNAFGLTINLVTMFALIMVLGIIVDDAIVIAENIYRHIEAGYAPKEAAILGTNQVALAVIATVLTTVAAFVPIFFMSGIIGKFIRVMPLVVIAALTASLVESLFVLPSHLAESVPIHLQKHRKRRLKSRFEIGFQLLRIRYLKLLRWVIHHRSKALILVMAICVFAFSLFKTGMKFVLFPQGLIEEFFIRVKTPIGTSLEETERRMRGIESLIKELPPEEIENFVTQVGTHLDDPTDPATDRGSHLGQIHVFLTPERSRKRKADEIIDSLREKTRGLSPFFEEITFEKVRAGPPVGKPITIQLRGDDLERLARAADLFKAKLAEIDGVKDIKDDYDPGKPELRVFVDGEEAKKAFLTVRDVGRTVRNAIEGQIATTIQKSDEEIKVRVRYPESYTHGKGIFDHLYVPNRFGKLIALKKVTRREEVPGIRAIKRLDRKRLVQVMADVDEKRVTPIEVQKKIEAFRREVFQKQYPDVTVRYGGEQEETQESIQDLFRAFGLALFLIFIILACNFNSVTQPFVVMVAIPFGIVGVIFAFFFHGKPLSFMALLGLIGLSGVVVNDSIILMDFINDHRRRGFSRAAAVFHAGRLRLRPVLLTSITTIAGLLPTAYGLGGSDPFVMPMALAIGWGLLFATLLTLLVIPTIYVFLDDLKIQGRRLARTVWEDRLLRRLAFLRLSRLNVE